MVAWKRRLVLAILALCPFLVASAGEAGDGPRPYVIGIEDLLGIVVWNEPELTLDVQVRPDGRITVPLLADVHVAGKAPEQLAAELTRELGKYVTDPSVTVIVREIRSYKVYFLGEVATQGALTFNRPTRLLQGIASAGGLTQFAKKEITLLREIGGIEKRYFIDYKKLIAGDPGQENLLLEPGDTLLSH